LEIQQSRTGEKIETTFQSFSVTVEAGVSLESRKPLKKPKLDVLDEALWIRFCQERQKGTPISGPIIKEKSLNLIIKMGDQMRSLRQVKCG
jgi:hypothetical protein